MTFLIGGFRLTNFGDFRLTVFGQFNPTLTIASGDMAFTVYQSATGQGEAAVKVAVSLANHQSASSSGLDVSEDGKYVWVPFEAVDATNVTSYQ